MAPSNDMDAFRRALASAKQVGIVAGAGLSAASGIPTFRGAGGYWGKYDAMSLATPEAFEADPSLVTQFYSYRREVVLRAPFNNAHRALGLLNSPEILKRIAPKSAVPRLITQNVDGLSLRVLSTIPRLPADAQKNVYQMHGELFRTLCLSCGASKFDMSSPLCPALKDAATIWKDGQQPLDIPVEKLPRCGGEGGERGQQGACGGLLRPAVVWFGEMPLHLDEIGRFLSKCDLLMVVGTSSVVYPAAGFASQVKRRGGTIAVFNLERSSGDDEADFLFLGPCEETLPKALTIEEEVKALEALPQPQAGPPKAEL